MGISKSHTGRFAQLPGCRDIKDEFWEEIKDLIPPPKKKKKSKGGRPRLDLRLPAAGRESDEWHILCTTDGMPVEDDAERIR
jgi:hypothetical protein